MAGLTPSPTSAQPLEDAAHRLPDLSLWCVGRTRCLWCVGRVRCLCGVLVGHAVSVVCW